MKRLALLFFPLVAFADCHISGKVTSLPDETSAACPDCQMRIAITSSTCREPLKEGRIVLAVTREAHHVAAGSRVSVRVLPAREDESGAYIVVRVLGVRR